MFSRVLRPSLACLPRLQTPPLTARPPMPTETTPLWSGQMTRKLTRAHWSDRSFLQRQKKQKVRIHHRLLYEMNAQWMHTCSTIVDTPAGCEKWTTALTAFNILFYVRAVGWAVYVLEVWAMNCKYWNLLFSQCMTTFVPPFLTSQMINESVCTVLRNQWTLKQRLK